MRIIISCKKIVNVILFLLISTSLLYGQAQSFYVSGGGTVTNTGSYGVVRGYCLEVNKTEIGDNITNLIKYYGSVSIHYKNGTSKVSQFDDLISERSIGLKGLGTYGFLGIEFFDKNIESITFLNDGVILYRDVNDLSRLQKNQRRIQDSLAKGMSPYQAQIEAWQPYSESNKFINDTYDSLASDTNKLMMEFTQIAHVAGTINDQPVIDIDMTHYDSTKKYGTLLFTHWHTDHINAEVLDRLLAEKNYKYIILPNISDDSSINKAFESLRKYFPEGIPTTHDNQLIIISKDGTFPTCLSFDFGDFNCYSIDTGDKIKIDVYKHKYLESTNNAGLISHVKHKYFSYLFFGDFDNIDGINNLIETSKNNEREYMAIREEMHESHLALFTVQSKLDEMHHNLYNISSSAAGENISLQELSDRFNHDMDSASDIVLEILRLAPEYRRAMSKNNKFQLMQIQAKINSFNTALAEIRSELEMFYRINCNGSSLEADSENYVNEILKLFDESLAIGAETTVLYLNSLQYPFLRSNIIKWFHHGHNFNINKDKRILDTVSELEKVIRPDFYLFEEYPNQDINPLLNEILDVYPALENKFISSDAIRKYIFSNLPKREQKIAA